MEDHLVIDIIKIEFAHQMWAFCVIIISLLISLPILLLFVRSNSMVERFYS
jgi:hypothetical protein